VKRYAICVLVVGIAAGAEAPPVFEVASARLVPSGTGLTSIGPYGKGRFTASNVSLEILIAMAFGVSSSQVVGGPGWMGSERYDVTAKPEAEVSLTYEELKPRLQQLLAQRFKLAVHRETKDARGYALVTTKSGPKLKQAASDAQGGFILPRGLRNPSATMDLLASMLARPLGCPVVNKTGIQGNFEIVLNYAPEGVAGSSLPSIFTAVREQLGLKLEAQTVPLETLVIDQVERVPAEN
jgi:uncharacterized protein (TIGR03435 family)